MEVLISLILIASGMLIGITIDMEEQSIRIILTIVSVALCILGSLLVMKYIVVDEPRAIDVYQGKTELKTIRYYEDTTLVKIDSTVVWKEGFR